MNTSVGACPFRTRTARNGVSCGRRLIFEPPTYCYKTGVAFLAWLNGLQPRFSMLDGFERRRSAGHLIRVFELAAAAGALTDPERAVSRMSAFLKEHA